MERETKKTNKLVILLVVILILILLVVGLVVFKGRTTSQNNDGSPQTDNISQTNNTNSNNNNDSQLANTFKIPGKDIYINVPNWQKIEKGYTDIFILHGKKYIAVTSDYDSKNPTLSEAHESAFGFYKRSIQNYSYVNDLNIEKEKTMTINGIKVYRYEGKLNCSLNYGDEENTYDAYAIGYSFVMEGIACNITGSVIDEEQQQADIKEVREIVDAMMKSVRSEE